MKEGGEWRMMGDKKGTAEGESMEPLSLQEFAEALAAGAAKNKNDERYLRLMLWWLFNDRIRDFDDRIKKAEKKVRVDCITKEELEKMLAVGNVQYEDDKQELRLALWGFSNDWGKHIKAGSAPMEVGVLWENEEEKKLWHENLDALYRLIGTSSNRNDQLMRAEILRELGEFERATAHLDKTIECFDRTAALLRTIIPLWYCATGKQMDEIEIDDALYGIMRLKQHTQAMRQRCQERIPSVFTVDMSCEPLHRAACDSVDVEVLKDLVSQSYISHQAYINIEDHQGRTPLHYAAKSNSNAEIVKYLVEKGANVHATGGSGDFGTPLHYAAGFNPNVEIVKYLIEKGADVNAKDMNGETPLHRAGCNPNVEVLKYLIEKGADVNMKAKSNETPLHRAAYNPNIEAVKCLIEKGADVNVRYELYDTTPLQHAAGHNSNVEVLKYLVAKSADASTKNRRGRTLLHAAACFNESIEVLEYLIEKGADVNAKDKDDNTPLHEATKGYNKNVEVVKYLIKKGANVNAKNDTGGTPLHHAAGGNPNNDWSHYPDVEILKHLIEQGADVNAICRVYGTPLDLARTKEKQNILREAGGKSKKELTD